MASTYPGALDNIPSNKSDTTTAAGDHAPHHNLLADAINAVQTALGVDLGNVEAAGESAAAVAAHVAASDPHAQYTTAAESEAIADTRISASDKVSSNVAGITGADQVTNIVSLTQAEYDAIGTKNAATLYVIAG